MTNKEKSILWFGAFIGSVLMTIYVSLRVANDKNIQEFCQIFIEK